MEPYYQDNHVTVWNKDCRSMSELADNSVQMCVTSPPYWGLRKYSGNQDLIWGSVDHCEHNKWETAETKQMSYIQGNPEFVRPHREFKNFQNTTNTCSICGTWRGAYGLEPTVDLYVQHTIEILREIRRVLRKNGVVFWNIGDSYAGGGNYRGLNSENTLTSKQASNRDARGIAQELGALGKDTGTAKPKDLCLIPFRIAMAAQADGWWVRSVIIWNKPNPMPESVRDRPTESHEYILMLTKSANYYYDMEAVREPMKPESYVRGQYGYAESDRDKLGESHHGKGFQRNDGSPVELNPNGRNLRSVWTFPTQPYKNAHFATFPEALPERCIKAGTPEYGCCDKCGMPYERVTELTPEYEEFKLSQGWQDGNDEPRLGFQVKRQSKNTHPPTVPIKNKTLGWHQACSCQDSKPVPSTVLDCFAGRGTTLWVAKKLGRKAVGYELSQEYCELIIDSNKQQVFF